MRRLTKLPAAISWGNHSIRWAIFSAKRLFSSLAALENGAVIILAVKDTAGTKLHDGYRNDIATMCPYATEITNLGDKQSLTIICEKGNTASDFNKQQRMADLDNHAPLHVSWTQVSLA